MAKPLLTWSFQDVEDAILSDSILVDADPVEFSV
jgi:hypothetical protein